MVDDNEYLTKEQFETELNKRIEKIYADLANDLTILDQKLSALEDKQTRSELFMNEVSYNLKKVQTIMQKNIKS